MVLITGGAFSVVQYDCYYYKVFDYFVENHKQNTLPEQKQGYTE